MNQTRIIHWPEGPQQGDIHTEGGRTWEYVLMPDGASVEGVWRDVGCKDIVVDGPSWTLDDVKDWLGIEGDDGVFFEEWGETFGAGGFGGNGSVKEYTIGMGREGTRGGSSSFSAGRPGGVAFQSNVPIEVTT